MEMIMRYKVSFDNNNFDKEKHYIDVGGNTFIINKMEIPFDFEAFGYNLDIKEDKVYLEYESGEGFLWNDYELDGCFDEEYAKLGLIQKDITAEFLASTEKIDEMSLSCEAKDEEFYPLINIEYEYIEFEDLESGEVYIVNKEVLKAYNKLINKTVEV